MIGIKYGPAVLPGRRRGIINENPGAGRLFFSLTIYSIYFIGLALGFLGMGGCGTSSSGSSPEHAGITGHVYGGDTGLYGVPVYLDGDRSRMTLTGEDGSFEFHAIPAGNYTIIPEKNGFSFTPAALTVTMEDVDSEKNDFFGSRSETAVRTWQKTYGGDDDDSARAVCPTEDGGYVLVGDTWSFGGGQSDIGVIKVDADGLEQWGNTFGGADEDVANDAYRTRNGDIVIVGGSRSFGGPDMSIVVVRIDPEGTVTWLKTYGDSGDDVGYAVSETEDGGIVVAGQTQRLGEDAKMGILKLDKDGNQLWYHKDRREGVGAARKLCFPDADHIFAMGDMAADLNQPADVSLMSLDRDGRLNWVRSYAREGNNTALAMYPAGDGAMLSAAKTTDPDGMDTEVFILQTDQSGAPVATLASPMPDGTQVADVAPLPDRGAVLTGRVYDDGENTAADTFVLKLNPKGQIEWCRTISGMISGWNHTVASCEDGGYILAGEIVLPEKSDLDFQALKLDPLGQLIQGPTIASPALKSGTAGQFYRSQPLVVSGGSGEFDLEIIGSHTARYFSITSKNEVTGDLPETAGRLTLSIRARDLNDPSYAVVKEFAIHILPHRQGAVGGGSGYTGTVPETAADIVVGELSSFLEALQSAGEGEVIYIRRGAVLDMSGMENIVIPPGVTIAGGRGMVDDTGTIQAGPLIHKDAFTKNSPLFVTGGEGVRITGLRIQGPGPYFEADYTVVDGVHYLNHDPPPTFDGSFGISTAHDLEIDNCEFYNWSYAAVYVTTQSAVRPHIHHNDIHDCKGSMGYGIEVYTGNPVIAYNRFSSLKHAISGTGLYMCGYEAAYNEVTKGVTAFYGPGWGMSPIFMQAFDMHNDMSTGDLAGNVMMIYGNTFSWTLGPGVKVRGTPRQLSFVFDNVFHHDTIDLGVHQQNTTGNMVVFDNRVDGGSTMQSDWQP